MGHRDETMIAQTLSNVARPRVVARAQFGAVRGFDPLRVSPKARGNFQVVASVTKKPDLSDPVLRAKLAKGMGHNYYAARNFAGVVLLPDFQRASSRTSSSVSSPWPVPVGLI